MAVLASCGGSGTSDQAICANETTGFTADGAPVAICQKTFADAPLVRPPEDIRTGDVQTINGALDLDIRQDESGVYRINDARLIDRSGNEYVLVDKNGVAIDETYPLMQSNLLPSNRVHFLIFEAKGAVSGDKFRLDALKPVIMVTGHALDERFLGAWEGTASLYDGGRTWSQVDDAKIRVEFGSLVPHENMATLVATITPPLPDGTRFKAIGVIANADKGVRLSTGVCAPSLRSLGSRNPFFEASDSQLTLWRFPAMHTAASRDYHVVMDYPKDLYPSAIAMATDHNFHLADYNSSARRPEELVFHIHGNPVQQIVITLKPVQGGGGSC
jgi:hypothetical protein